MLECTGFRTKTADRTMAWFDAAAALIKLAARAGIGSTAAFQPEKWP
jgi:hypothetical protein